MFSGSGAVIRSGPWRSSHSRQATTTMELMGKPVSTSADSSRRYISSENLIVVDLVSGMVEF
jgi:hypothetical protein